MKKILLVGFFCLLFVALLRGQGRTAEPMEEKTGIVTTDAASSALESHLARFHQRYSLLDQVVSEHGSIGEPSGQNGEGQIGLQTRAPTAGKASK
jgi:hypothetical protein